MYQASYKLDIVTEESDTINRGVGQKTNTGVKTFKKWHLPHSQMVIARRILYILLPYGM
jgi:hypothetical protein